MIRSPPCCLFCALRLRAILAQIGSPNHAEPDEADRGDRRLCHGVPPCFCVREGSVTTARRASPFANGQAV